MADAEIENMRKRMTNAAQVDAFNRREGKPAMHKLKMLPEVVSLLNRNQYVNSLVDPEINLLEAVKFFLEPLDDGSLPAYNIQRDLMNALARLPINKEVLVASGIGKVIVFYTKSKRPEPAIKRLAERLLAEWTRPILQRSDDYSKRVYQEAAFDPTYVLPPTLPIWSLPDLELTIPPPPENSPTVHPPPKQQQQRLVPANCSLPVWQTVPVPTTRIPAIPWCRDQPSCRRANSLDLWEPAARTGSDVCGHDRLLPPRDLANNCIFLFLRIFHSIFGLVGVRGRIIFQILVLVNWNHREYSLIHLHLQSTSPAYICHSGL